MESNKSPEIDKLLAALSKAQSEIEGAKENSKNPHFKSSYPDLFSVWQACKKPLTDNGLSIIQTFQPSGDKTLLITILGHSSGQWISSVLPMPIVKNDPQGLGSCVTYCRRYALSALVGVCPMDDDAEAAMHRMKKEEEKANEPKGWDAFTQEQKKDIVEAIGDDEDLYCKVDAWIGEKNPPYDSVMKRLTKTKVAV